MTVTVTVQAETPTDCCVSVHAEKVSPFGGALALLNATVPPGVVAVPGVPESVTVTVTCDVVPTSAEPGVTEIVVTVVRALTVSEAAVVVLFPE